MPTTVLVSRKIFRMVFSLSIFRFQRDSRHFQRAFVRIVPSDKQPVVDKYTSGNSALFAQVLISQPGPFFFQPFPLIETPSRDRYGRHAPLLRTFVLEQHKLHALLLGIQPGLFLHLVQMVLPRTVLLQLYNLPRRVHFFSLCNRLFHRLPPWQPHVRQIVQLFVKLLPGERDRFQKLFHLPFRGERFVPIRVQLSNSTR
mmetsp:Transcript_1268/g.3907  ORF Transcript_1268/g.3907 Transcript_1268/m.3907 type:complete len:200 (+) Transcript_1268:50-649(+)